MRWRRWTILVPGLATFLLRVALIPVDPLPQPSVHDEFSYLLGADTFSHGRLTNPPHPLWRFFETVHVISVPTYASKYPPGQALFLWAGQALFHHPYFGVLLGLGFFSSAVCWMLEAWSSPGYALLGGLFTSVAFGFGHYWAESYWGGQIAAGAGALVLGTLGRIRQRGDWSSAWPLALGSVLLWFTRPLEGAFLVLAVAGLIGLDVAKNRLPPGRKARTFVATLLACGVLTVSWQGYYDWRVTGDPLTLPYMLHQRQYDYLPILWFQPLRTPALAADPAVNRFHEAWERNLYGEVRAGSVPARALRLAYRPWKTLLSWGPLAVAMFLSLFLLSGFFLRDRGMRTLWLVVFACTIPLFFEIPMRPHYLGPFLVSVLAVIFRLLSLLGSRGVASLYVLGTLVLGFLFPNIQLVLVKRVLEPQAFAHTRDLIEREIVSHPGPHVAFVHYSPQHDIDHEWVYNGAEIDAQPLIWARDRGEEENRKLIRYYSGRKFWLVDADARPAAVRPYPLP